MRILFAVLAAVALLVSTSNADARGVARGGMGARVNINARNVNVNVGRPASVGTFHSRNAFGYGRSFGYGFNRFGYGYGFNRFGYGFYGGYGYPGFASYSYALPVAYEPLPVTYAVPAYGYPAYGGFTYGGYCQ